MPGEPFSSGTFFACAFGASGALLRIEAAGAAVNAEETMSIHVEHHFYEDTSLPRKTIEERLRENELAQFESDLNPNESPLSWKEYFWSWVPGFLQPES